VPLRPHELRAALDDLKRFVEAEGRDPKAVTISFKAPLYDVSPVGQFGRQPEHERQPFSGSPGQVVEDIAAYGKLGVSELIFDFRSEDLHESLERMERFGNTVKPAAEGL
jgi:alkanesulfonate monooxygenase SsuD/methylene tetrahydromethanopterin reductase-like flavin-dependent oxidoreductase (luciferase family)